MKRQAIARLIHLGQLLPGFLSNQNFMEESHCWIRYGLKFAKRHLGDSTVKWKKVLLSYETKVELFGPQTRRYVWRTPEKNPGNSCPMQSLSHLSC